MLLEEPFRIQSDKDFNSLALQLFQLHAISNPVYKEYLQALGVDVAAVRSVDRIPFLPIGLFRNRQVLLDGLEATLQFTSSGTTGSITSTHQVPWPELYQRSFLSSFSADL